MNKTKQILSGAIALSILSVTAGANAAEDESDSAEMATELQESEAEGEMPVAEAKPENEAEEAEAEDAEEPTDEGETDQGRFRFGISGMGGPYMGAYKGGAGGLDLRFGWQLNDAIGIVLQPQLALGFGAQADEDSASFSATALSGVGLLADYTLADFFYAGAGLGFTTGAFASGSLSTTSGSAQAADGPFFEIPFRVGLALGSKKPSRRNAFTIGINGQMIFVNSDVATASSDGTAKNEKKFGVVMMPLLALGYESF